MIPSGSYLCVSCGCYTTDAYYRNPTVSYIVKLTRKRFFFRNASYQIEAYNVQGSKDGGSIIIGDKLSDIELCGTSAQEIVPGIPTRINTKKNGDSKSIPLSRCCPYCGKDNPSYDGGKADTYVVLVGGPRTAGKTKWLNALASTDVISKLNSDHNFPYCIEIGTRIYPTTNQEQTEEDSIGSTNFIHIKKRNQPDKTVASVILMDAAGECFRQLAERTGRIYQFLTGGRECARLDGLIFVDSPKTDGALTVTIQNLLYRYVPYIRRIPVARIHTHLDEYLNHPNAIPVLEDEGENASYPLFNRSTFRNQNLYDIPHMLPRWKVQDLAGSKMNPTLRDDIATDNLHYFLIKSGVPSADNKLFYHVDTLNILDPLLWMLHRLGLFPLKEGNKNRRR